MEIQYYRKSVFGNWLIYIKDKEIASAITCLTKKVTIDEYDIKNFELLGIKFTEVLPPRD